MGEGLNLCGMCRQKGSSERYVSSFIFQDHEAVLETFHEKHQIIIKLSLFDKY